MQDNSTITSSILTALLQRDFPNFQQILTNAPDRYLLTVPPNGLIQSSCEVDHKFVQEHILEKVGGDEFRSLTGKLYRLVEHELQLVVPEGSQDQDIYCSILSTDIYYTADKAQLSRYMISNTLDPRFYKEEEKPVEESSNSLLKRPGINSQSKQKIMRDPYEFINFFKQNVQFEVMDTYIDFLDDIKSLKENHIMIKGHERESGMNYMKLGNRFKRELESKEVVQRAFHAYPDQLKKATVENLCETLIYEKIGTFLRRSLVDHYWEEENAFQQKCLKLSALFHSDVATFNRLFGSNLQQSWTPNRSLKILRLFLVKSQLPYEMLFILGKVLQMVVAELAEYTGRDPKEVDADSIAPYLALIIIETVAYVHKEILKNRKTLQEAAERGELEEEIEEPPADGLLSRRELMTSALSCRFLMIEHFSVHEMGYGEGYYAFASFKGSERMIEEVQL